MEEVSASRIELAGVQTVMQYRGEIVPVVWVTDVLGEPPHDWPTGILSVVVYREGGRDIGLVVDRVIDVIEATVELHTAAMRPGVCGTAVLQDRVTEMLDLATVLKLADPWAKIAFHPEAV